MIEKVFAPVLKFFGIVASSLTGMSAVFTAAGFLAERSHLHMLGFTLPPADLNLYLYTGARFLAYLPLTSLTAIGLGTLDLGKRYFLVFFAAILGLIFIHLLLKIGWLKRLAGSAGRALESAVRANSAMLLFLLVLLQFVAIYSLLQTTQVSNILFSQPEAERTAPGFPVAKTTIASWIVQQDVIALFKYMGVLFLLIILSVYFLWRLTSTIRQKKTAKISLWQSIWLGINLLLVGTQLILLPINYGILLIPNEYPRVSVTLQSGDAAQALLPVDSQLYLLLQQPDRFYFYVPDKKQIWMLKSADVRRVIHHGLADVFESSRELDSKISQ